MDGLSESSPAASAATSWSPDTSLRRQKKSQAHATLHNPYCTVLLAHAYVIRGEDRLTQQEQTFLSLGKEIGLPPRRPHQSNATSVPSDTPRLT